ncbi:MAG: MarR family transcriptional regulator [Actinomycetota bacterium]
MTTLEESSVGGHLDERLSIGHTLFRENRGLWQLTPDGRAAHADELAADLDGLDIADAFADAYDTFLSMNAEFKHLCGDWQLKGGEPNDHSDPGYDGDVIDRLSDLHERAHPIVDAFGSAVDRFGPYSGRLAAVLERVRAGESNLFTGVMCGSYHDVWMELHEDLILSQGIDRTAEGSF